MSSTVFLHSQKHFEIENRSPNSTYESKLSGRFSLLQGIVISYLDHWHGLGASCLRIA